MKTTDADVVVIGSCLSCAAEKNSWQMKSVTFSVPVPKQFSLPPLLLLLVPARADNQHHGTGKQHTTLHACLCFVCRCACVHAYLCVCVCACVLVCVCAAGQAGRQVLWTDQQAKQEIKYVELAATSHPCSR